MQQIGMRHPPPSYAETLTLQSSKALTQEESQQLTINTAVTQHPQPDSRKTGRLVRRLNSSPPPGFKGEGGASGAKLPGEAGGTSTALARVDTSIVIMPSPLAASS